MHYSFRDCRERRKLKGEIHNLMLGVLDRDYATIGEANSKLKIIYDLIEKANLFNQGTSGRKIDAANLLIDFCMLEQRVEDHYFSGGLDVA